MLLISVHISFLRLVGIESRTSLESEICDQIWDLYNLCYHKKSLP